MSPENGSADHEVGEWAKKEVPKRVESNQTNNEWFWRFAQSGLCGDSSLLIKILHNRTHTLRQRGLMIMSRVINKVFSVRKQGSTEKERSMPASSDCCSRRENQPDLVEIDFF